MSITVEQCRQYIQQGTQPAGLWTPEVEDLLLGTAIQESNLEYTQQTGGPAIGYFQMEPLTFSDIWVNYLAYRPDLANPIRRLCPGTTPLPNLMVSNHPLAAVMARVKYLRSPMPIPALGDVAGMAAIYKQVYNTPEGDATEAEFIANWNRVMNASQAAD